MEYVDIVDELDNVIKAVPHKEMRDKNLRHRGSVIIVLNSKKEFLIQKRQNTAKVYPGYFASGAGGCISSKELYEVAAIRELREEVGIKDVDLYFLFKYNYEDEQTKAILQLYYCIYEGKITVQEEEVAGFFWQPIDEVEEFMKINKYAPDDILIFKKFYKMYKKGLK